MPPISSNSTKHIVGSRKGVFTKSAAGGLNPSDFLIEGSGVTPYSAFSFRALSSVYLASGSPCVRVRRGSDNVESDIGFVQVAPTTWYLDTATLQAFADASPTAIKACYVVRVYDQTGNGRDRYTGIANRQPIIVNNGGTIQNQNNYVGARFSTSSHTLQTLLAYGIGDSVWANGVVTFSSIYVNRSEPTNGINSLLVWDNGGSQYCYVANTGSGASAFGNYTQGTQYKNDAPVTINTRDDAYNELYNQRYILEDWGFTKWSTAQNNFGGYGLINGTNFNWDGYYIEEINYQGDQLANRTAIMNYITPFYSAL